MKRLIVVLFLLGVLGNVAALGAVSVEGNVLKIENDGNIFNRTLPTVPARFSVLPTTDVANASANITVTTPMLSGVIEKHGRPMEMQESSPGVWIKHLGYVPAEPWWTSNGSPVCDYAVGNPDYSGNAKSSAVDGGRTNSFTYTVSVPFENRTGYAYYYTSAQYSATKLKALYPWTLDLLGNHYGTIDVSVVKGQASDLSVRRKLGSSILLRSQTLPSTTVTTSFTWTMPLTRVACGKKYSVWHYPYYGIQYHEEISCDKVSTQHNYEPYSTAVGKSVTYYGVTAAQMAERER